MRNYLYLLLLGFFVAACGGGDDDPTTQGNDQQTNTNNNTTINNSGNNPATRIETPFLNDDDYFLTRYTTTNGKKQLNYTISYNSELQHSRWVAFTFDPSNRAINTSRTNNWNDQEPGLPQNCTLEEKTIGNVLGRGYNRGHLLASYDRLYSVEANEQTFYMSNISPMLADFNSSNTSHWDDLEQKINSKETGWGRSATFSDTLYVVKGGTITEGLYKKIDGITVPNFYFMALLRLKDGYYQAIAFKLPHTDKHSEKLIEYACTIDELEEFTGIDFFCNLKDNIENAVESSFDKSVWNL